MSSYQRRARISDPRIRELIDDADGLEDGTARVAMLEEAVNLADSLGDVIAAYEARLELIEAAVFSGHPRQALVAYAWCLAKQPEDPELFDEYELIWRYKWVATRTASFPTIPRSEILAAVDDMESRIRRLGGTSRIVHDVRWTLLADMGRYDEAAQEFALWKDAPADDFSDCDACELDSEVWWHLQIDQRETALTLAKPILAGKMSCTYVPQMTYAQVLEPLWKAQRTEEAATYHRRGYRTLRDVPSDLNEASNHLLYLALSENKSKGVRVLERFLPLAAQTHDLDHRFWFYRSAVAMFGALAGKQDRRRKLRLPKTLACYAEDESYRPGELEEWFRRESQQIAQQFDRRNESTRFADALGEV